jgi:hypothetical protein
VNKKKLTLLISIVAALAVGVGLYLGLGSVNQDIPPSLPSIGGSQFAGSTQVIQINNANGVHSSLIKPACNGRYKKSLEFATSPLYISAFGVNKTVTVNEFLSKVSPDNQHYVMLLFNQVTQSYVELGSNMFGSLPRISVEEFDTYKIASNQMVYFFTNKSNEFCFESDRNTYKPIVDVNGWALVQLYNTQFVSNVKFAYKFNDQIKPEKFTDNVYEPGFYWFAFDYTDFTEDFGDESIAVSPFGNYSDKSIYLRNAETQNISLGVLDVISENPIDRLEFEVKSQTLEEFLSITQGLQLSISGNTFDVSLPDSLSETNLFVVELTPQMQNALLESKQIEIFALIQAAETNQTLDFSLVFQFGDLKSESEDLLNVDVYLSDLSLALADSAANLELINGLKIADLEYANVDFALDGDVDVEYLKIKLLDELEIDSANDISFTFKIDSSVVATHRFTNQESEILLPTEVAKSLLTADGTTLEILSSVDLFDEQSDLDFVLEAKILIADEPLLVELPSLTFADAKKFLQFNYYTFAESCELDSNIYYNKRNLLGLKNVFSTIYSSFYDDFATVESLNLGVEMTPYVDISDIKFNVDIFGSDPVEIPKTEGFTNLFEYNFTDFDGGLINFASDTYTEDFTDDFNSKRLLSFDKLQLSNDKLSLRFNLTSSPDSLEKIEHRCEFKSNYGFNVEDIAIESKILISDLSQFIKLNFTNLVLGKNVFVQIDWEESLLALLDFNSNPLITSLSGPDDITMTFGFEDSDLDEFDNILDKLLADLGDADGSISEEELENLIESSPISLTVGNQNSNFITKQYDPVYLSSPIAVRLGTDGTCDLAFKEIEDFTGAVISMDSEFNESQIKLIFTDTFTSEDIEASFVNSEIDNAEIPGLSIVDNSIVFDLNLDEFFKIQLTSLDNFDGTLALTKIFVNDIEQPLLKVNLDNPEIVTLDEVNEIELCNVTAE